VQSDWQQAARPGFRVELSYPVVTPRGVTVERTEDANRVHLRSPGGELYVELARFEGLAPEGEYARHRPYLEERFGEGAVTELIETSVGERPAWSYGFRWDDGERSVLLLKVGEDTYRVIHDPRSELNAEVVATLLIVG
jgi:hypothetical protein